MKNYVESISKLHLHCRMRNMKNRLSNAAEVLGLGRNTPMAVFLDSIGIESEFKVQ